MPAVQQLIDLRFGASGEGYGKVDVWSEVEE